MGNELYRSAIRLSVAYPLHRMLVKKDLMATATQSQFDLILLIKWVVANLIGSIIGMLLFAGIQLTFLFATGPIVFVIVAVLILLVGAAIGAAQAYPLVNRIR